VYVCICHGVTECQVSAEIADGARTPEEIGQRTGAGTGCGVCVRRICRLLAASGDDRGRIAVGSAV
jgi:bacterioferritin-associated ferredoxin